MTTIANIEDHDVEELAKPDWKRPMTRQASAATDRANLFPSPDSRQSPSGGNPTAQILNGRYDNIRATDNSKVHTGNNYYQQNAGENGHYFQIGENAKVQIDPSVLRDGPVHYQVNDSAQLVVGYGSSERTGALMSLEATDEALTLRDTYGISRLHIGPSTLHLNRRKLAYQAGKITDTAPYVAYPNSIYPTLRSPRIKTELAHIAQNFQLLDMQLASYFKSIVLLKKLAREDLGHLLREARGTVRKVQHELGDQQEVVLGDLGQFCEDVTDEAREDTPVFKSTDSGVDARLRYLQDAYLDVPYWCFILELFANGQGKAEEMAIRTMSHVKLDSINRMAKLRENAATWTGVEVEDVKNMGPILAGIHARLECLDNVCHSHALDLETSPLLSKLLLSRSMSFSYAAVSPADKDTGQEDAASAHRIENEVVSAGPPLVIIEMQDKSNVSPRTL